MHVRADLGDQADQKANCRKKGTCDLHEADPVKTLWLSIYPAVKQSWPVLAESSLTLMVHSGVKLRTERHISPNTRRMVHMDTAVAIQLKILPLWP
jgi:hypothetical protein